MSCARPTVAIVGGGFSGAAVAFHLTRVDADADIVVFEPRARLGGGLAYGGDDPVHRVNVPATRMSILPDDPQHFARWLEASGVLAADPQAHAGGEVYPRRREFGRYVEECLKPYVATGAIRHVRSRVASLQKRPGGWWVQDASGATLQADVAVIATTHPACSTPPQLAKFCGEPGLIVDGLAEGVVRSIRPKERVLIVGAGLTAADLVAALDAQGHRGPITMISRRGLRARGRALTSFAPVGDFLHPAARSASALLARVRRAARDVEATGGTWQAVIEGVRNQGQEIWRALDPEARRRIVRHLRPFWDAHRFRAAPQIEAIVEARLKNAGLELKRARLGRVARADVGYHVELRHGAKLTTETRTFDRILVAIGPTHRDILFSQPFLTQLSAAGAVTLDPTELGLQTSREGRAIGADGQAHRELFIAGPLARGTFGELMGLPQVAEYAAFVASGVAECLGRKARRELSYPPIERLG